MEKSRLKKASWNIIWLVAYQITIFICNMILPRLIISTYGSAYNGMITSITQFLNFVSVLRLGVAGATRVALYKPLAENNIAEISSIVKATEKYMQKISYVIIGYIAVLAFVYPIYIKSEYGYVNVALLVIAIGIGIFAQYFFGITYQTLLQADQRLYIYNIFQIMATILNTILSVVLICRGTSIQVVKMISAVIFFITPVLLNKYVLFKYGIDKKCNENSKALDKTRDVMGHSIANIVHENTDVIVLTLFCDIKIVSVYSVYNLIMSGLKQVLSVFTTGVEAVFGSMWAKGENEKIIINLGYYEYLISAFVAVVFGVTSVLIIPFVQLYTSNITDVEYIIPIYALIIVVAQAFYCIRMPYMMLVQAAGHYKETKKGAYAEAMINILLSVVLVQSIGIIGTAIGTLLANIYRTIQYYLYVSRCLVSRNRCALIKRVIWITANVLGTYFLCTKYILTYASNSWGMWVLCGLFCILIAGILCVMTSLLFYSKDMKGIISILLRMLRKG